VQPRILLVGYQDRGSPPSGAKLRFDATVRGLAAIATVDYLQWKPPSGTGRGRLPP
jgi:hypothetical protein